MASDSFAGRTITGGWGKASDGNTWAVVAGDGSLMSDPGSSGTVSGSNSMASIRATLGPGTAANTEVVARYTSRDYWNDCGHLLVGYSSPSNYYVAGLDSPNGSPELNIWKVVNGTPSRVANTPFPATNGTAFWERVRVQASGSSAVVSVRAWQSGTTEPAGWGLTWTDSSPLPAGQAGVESWDDGAGWAIDHFSAGNLSSPTPIPSPSPTPIPSPTPPPPPPAGTPVAAGTLVGQDTFAGRTVTNGWGTASDGLPWVLQAGTGSQMVVASNRGRVSGNNAMATIRATLGTSAGDTEVVTRYTSGDYANDCGHAVLRLSDAGDYYAAGLDSPNGTPELNVMKVVRGVQTRVANVTFAATNGIGYWERVRIQTSGTGAVISVKAWTSGTAEPAGWNLTYTDGSPLPAGVAGVESWDDGRGWAIDNFSAGAL